MWPVNSGLAVNSGVDATPDPKRSFTRIAPTHFVGDLAERPFAPWVILLVLCSALFLPGIATLPVTDRDEGRFVQASRQMLESGNFVDIRFQDKPRYKKPAGAYWAQAASVALVQSPEDTAIWPYRVPSFLAATFTVLAIFFLAQRFMARRIAFLGAGIVASTVVVIVEAHIAKADALLLFFVTGTQLLLGWIFHHPKLTSRWAELARASVVWILLAGGTLVKGPVAPAVFAVSLFALVYGKSSRAWIRSLYPLIGLPLFAALILPWLLAVQRQSGGEFVATAWTGDILPKLVGAHESHGGPPGYYALLSMATFWPWSLFSVLGVRWLWLNRKEPTGIFLLSWLLPNWVVLELVPTKLPHYSLPLLAPLALGIAHALSTTWRATPRWLDASTKVTWWVIGFALLGAMIALPLVLGATIPLGMPLAAVLFGGALCAAFVDRPVALLFGSLGVTCFLALGAPFLDRLWTSEQIARQVGKIRGTRPAIKTVAAAGYAEPSLVFLLGTKTLLGTPAEVGVSVRSSCAVLGIVRKKELPEFFDNCGGQQEVDPLGELRSFNYSSGKWVELSFWRKRGCS